jgi:hypothetical protein
MLTTEVVKGLLAGNVYRRTIPSPFDTWEEIRIKGRNLFTRNNNEKEWVTCTFGLVQLEAVWKEMIEWQEIDWKEAVECDEENIPLQFLSNIDSEWIDKEKPFENCLFSFVRDHQWRKKVEVKNG